MFVEISQYVLGRFKSHLDKMCSLVMKTIVKRS